MGYLSWRLRNPLTDGLKSQRYARGTRGSGVLEPSASLARVSVAKGNREQ